MVTPSKVRVKTQGYSNPADFVHLVGNMNCGFIKDSFMAVKELFFFLCKKKVFEGSGSDETTFCNT